MDCWPWPESVPLNQESRGYTQRESEPLSGCLHLDVIYISFFWCSLRGNVEFFLAPCWEHLLWNVTDRFRSFLSIWRYLLVSPCVYFLVSCRSQVSALTNYPVFCLSFPSSQAVTFDTKQFSTKAEPQHFSALLGAPWPAAIQSPFSVLLPGMRMHKCARLSFDSSKFLFGNSCSSRINKYRWHFLQSLLLKTFNRHRHPSKNQLCSQT